MEFREDITISSIRSWQWLIGQFGQAYRTQIAGVQSGHFFLHAAAGIEPEQRITRTRLAKRTSEMQPELLQRHSTGHTARQVIL